MSDTALETPAKTHPASTSLWKVAVVAMLGSLLAQLDATIVNVSLSSLAKAFSSPLSVIQWVTSGYLLALTFALPLNGWLVQRIGTKRLYLWCFALFTLSSALCGLAWSAWALIAFRLLQGISGGLMAPMAQMLVKEVAGDNFTKVAGYISLPVLLGPVLGPIIAGAIIHYASWRWLFLVNLPVGLVAWVLAARFLPADTGRYPAKKLDWLGLALLSPALVLGLVGLDQVTHPLGLAAVIASLILLLAFVIQERRLGNNALIDLVLFRLKPFRVAAITQFFANGAMYAGQMLVPLFLLEACGRSPAAMGWLLAPLGLGMMLTMPLLGFLSGRFGERRLALTGALFALLSTLGLCALATFGVNNAALAVMLFVRGAAMGAVGLPVMSIAYHAVDKKQLPMATTTSNIMLRLGGPTLTTLVALYLSWALGASHSLLPLNAWAQTFLVLALAHAVVLLAALLLPRKK
ncbi:DHA2 family efflux MFS transporter permease subunit [Gallaecimonas mangrovi]|uniref:DHA2 family efflux MFS transporter permease subunit n=1 Tax=Gallaecimonas mangrovi TaxID=2291597 RepID=UPI000E1FC83E|nr:DHA2 family efflux MFS transporter permease subunit [Gallaecimonas mangrovi]